MKWSEMIENHYCAVWDANAQVCDFSAGPINQLPEDFAVLRFEPRPERSMWTYATRCMSLPQDAKKIEIHMFSPFESIDIVEILVSVAHFHRTANALDVGHTVNFGRSWLDGSKCNYGLVSLPYLDGPSLENLSTRNSLVSFYWMIPISQSELTFKKKHGLEALELEFEQNQLDYINPYREPLFS